MLPVMSRVLIRSLEAKNTSTSWSSSRIPALCPISWRFAANHQFFAHACSLQFMARTGASGSREGENRQSGKPRVIRNWTVGWPAPHANFQKFLLSPPKLARTAAISNTLHHGSHQAACGELRRNQKASATGEPWWLSSRLERRSTQPLVWINKIRDADQKRMESNSLTLNLLKSRPSLGQASYKSPEPDVIHEPQQQKHRYNIRSAGALSAAEECP